MNYPMSKELHAPFWLEIRSEYLDANLEKVLSYLSREVKNRDSDPFFEETERLLDIRVRELIDRFSGSPLWGLDTIEKADLLLMLRLTGAWILIREPMVDISAREVYLFFIQTLSLLVPDTYLEDLTDLAVRSLASKSVVRVGFSWSDLKNIQVEVLAHKVIESAMIDSEYCPETWYQGHGSVRINEGFVEVRETNREDARFIKTTSSLMILDEKVSVQTVVSDRIQQKDEDSLEVMNTFTNSIIRTISKVTPSIVGQTNRYEVGDIMPVRYKGKDSFGNLLVETVDGDHDPISGRIPYRSNVFRNIYTAETVSHYLQFGDIFDAEYKGGERNTFDIQKPFLDALLDTIKSGTSIVAVLKGVNDRGLMTWWTYDGYPAYVEATDDEDLYSPGDYAKLLITGKGSNGYVYATIEDPSNESFDENESKRYCVDGILYPEDFEPASSPLAFTLGERAVSGMMRLLFRYQRTQERASERFKVLCLCRILAAMTDDSLSGEYLSFVCGYLRNLVLFSEGKIDKIRTIAVPDALAGIPDIIRRCDIIKILQEYGGDSDSETLKDVIAKCDDPVLKQLSKLVLSSNRIDDVYPAIKTIIRREIARFLAVKTEDNTDLEETVGPDLGVENSRTEFKTSFLFAPAGAAEQDQEKTIFRSLCSFLNTQEGGTLYLGVNDSGGINGLAEDLEALPRKTNNRYKGIDGYVRYITDRAREYFDLDVRIHFHIDTAYSSKVVAIRIDPYEHGVVEFEGIPYVRNNSESVKMSQTLRRQIEAKRVRMSKDKPSENIVALSEAIREERKVILHGYASSNSDAIGEYTVEPFAFVGNYSYVWAYDTDNRMNKVFRISRVGNVEITSEQWSGKAYHRKGEMDIFHFTGKDAVPMSLEMDVLARNLLTEEFPDSIADIKYIGDGRYLLTTKVFSMLGIGRFYCGLSGHISIINAPGLAEYAKEYYMKAMKGLV